MKLDSIGTPALWIGFTVFVLAMLVLDLGVFHRIPILVSLGVIVALLTGSVVASLLRSSSRPLVPGPPPDPTEG